MSNTERSELKAGIFVLVGIALIMTVVLMLTDIQSLVETYQTVTAEFTVANGLKGLKQGGPVTLGDVPIGSVGEIQPMFSKDGRVMAFKVIFQIDSKYKIYENARVYISKPMLGGNTSLNITSVGYGKDTDPKGAPAYTPKSPPLAGGVAPSEAVMDAIHGIGIEQKQRAQVQAFIANMNKLGDAFGSRSQSIGQSLDNIHTVTTDVKTMATELQEKLPGMVDNAQVAIKDLKDAVADAKVVIASARKRHEQWFQEIDVALASARQSIQELQVAIKDNHPKFDQAMDNAKKALANARQITEQFKTNSMAELDKAMTSANRTLADAEKIASQARIMVATQRPILERTIANARILSDQLKLASIEIRQSPWRLLYTPSNKEQEMDRVYDAARSYMMAANSLESTTAGMQALIDARGDKLNQADPELKLMLDNLKQSYQQYHQAQQQFWTLLQQAKDQ